MRLCSKHNISDIIKWRVPRPRRNGAVSPLFSRSYFTNAPIVLRPVCGKWPAMKKCVGSLATQQPIPVFAQDITYSNSMERRPMMIIPVYLHTSFVISQWDMNGTMGLVLIIPEVQTFCPWKLQINFRKLIKLVNKSRVYSPAPPLYGPSPHHHSGRTRLLFAGVLADQVGLGIRRTNADSERFQLTTHFIDFLLWKRNDSSVIL